MLARRTSPAGFPMAPSAEEWEALSPAERDAVVAALPGEVTYDEMAMPEGDLHSKAKVRALDALRGYFTRLRRRIYLTMALPIYYPAEPRFAPDLLAVLDRDAVDRDKWFVSAEGKGLDWVLEVHVGGDRKRDAELNIARYARLGIPEYFIYDRDRNRLAAYRLASPDARVYTAITPTHGLYESRVLGLDVWVDKDRLRFYTGTAQLLESDEIIARLQAAYADILRHAEEDRRHAEDLQRREEETRRHAEKVRRGEDAVRRGEDTDRRREEAEREVMRLRAEIERLKR